MFKSSTPKQIAFYASLITALVVFVLVITFNSSNKQLAPALNLVFLPTAAFLVSFLVVKYCIDTFIYRRIKVIYKKITEEKKGEAEPNVEGKSLEDVENIVDDWQHKQNQQITVLKELEEYRRNYIGNVSHELKTPIFNIQGFLHTLIDGGIEDPKISLSYLQKAAKNVERLESIVNDLDKIAQLESGKIALDIQTFDIMQLVKEVFEDVELRAKEKNIKLGFKDGADYSFRVKGDKDSIRQVLNNLLINSIKYGKVNGQTKVSFYDMDKIILIEISDNGIGIARHHLKHVFDRFYRVDKGRSRDVGGTGLGLSIVKHIIEAHNQTVHVRSTEGVGTTFGFTLEKSKS